MNIKDKNWLRRTLKDNMCLMEEWAGGDDLFRKGARLGIIYGLYEFTNGFANSIALLKELEIDTQFMDESPTKLTPYHPSALRGWLRTYVGVFIGFYPTTNKQSFIDTCKRVINSAPFRSVFPNGVPINVVPESWADIFPTCGYMIDTDKESYE